MVMGPNQLVVGAHARNELAITSRDVKLYKQARFGGLVFMWYQDPNQVLKAFRDAGVGIDPRNCVVRLPNSVYQRPDGTSYIPSWQQYSLDCTAVILRWYACGFRNFQIDNEPNLSWQGLKNESGAPLTCYDWAWFIGNAFFDFRLGARYQVAPDVKLGLTPIANPEISREWFAAMLNWKQERSNASLVELCDWAACHSYWQRYSDMYSTIFGSNFKWLYEMLHKPIFITECGNSKCQEPNPPSLDEIYLLQAQQYPQYAHWLSQSQFEYVRGVFFFILGHNGDWAGFDLTELVCENLGERTNGPAGGGRPAHTM